MGTPHQPRKPNGAMLAVIKEFHDLSPTDLESVGTCCHLRQYAPGEVILRFQDATDDIFFVVNGTVRITYYSVSGHEVLLGDLSAGEMFGELAAIDGLRRSATVVARVDSLLASMSASAFLHLVHRNKNVSTAILRRLTGRVRSLTQRVFDLSTLAVRNRIHVELLRLAKDRMVEANIAVISPAPTHSDLASLISSHREAVTRELSYLARSKLIKRDKRDLIILDIVKLKQMVHAVRGVSR